MQDKTVAIQIREATEQDLQAICVLGEAVNAMHHQREPHVFAGPGDPMQHAAHWRSTISMLAAGEATTFVAEGAQGVVGFVTVSIGTDAHTLFQPLRFARVGTVGVAPEHRSLGLGAQLMAHAQAWGLARGGTEMRLTVGAFNEDALRWYRHLGFEARSIALVKPLS
jgi:ribosomal protein S18 acetylase RimI-like enzyme